jgi:creatinine amidohydrolase/Fe(II)-dependent formamide hydrolase-like protein
MKNLWIVFGFLMVAGAHGGDTHGTTIDRPVEEVARTLQAKLPELAVDGMCEVSREDNGWNFTLRVKAGKSSAEEVQVLLRAAAARSELRIQGVRVESSLITTSRKIDAALSQQWSERILKLVENKT